MSPRDAFPQPTKAQIGNPPTSFHPLGPPYASEPARIRSPVSRGRFLSGRLVIATPEMVPLLAAGKAIAQGDHTRENLTVIFRWKTGGRGFSRLSRNRDEEIQEALSIAAQAQTARAALAVLLGLSGVDVRVASAVLTAVDPTRYTILDFRALEALGVSVAYYSVDLYLTYLSFCRGLSERVGVSLRDLDRALWQWSKEHGTPG